jgi:hypothetical protein
MVAWRFEAADWDDDTTRRLINPSSRKTTLRLNAPSFLAFSVNGDDDQAGWIEELKTDIILSEGPTEILRTRVGAATDSVGVTSYTVACTANDYRAVLERRKLRSSDVLSYSAVERMIAMALITTVQSRPNGSYGIILGAAPNGNGPVRNMNFKEGQWVGKEITSMLQLGAPGSHWDIGPDFTFNYWADGRGSANGIELEYGKSVKSFTQARTAGPFGNDALVTGSQGLTPANRESAGVATDPRGRWDLVTSYPDIQLQSTLDERADWYVDRAERTPAVYSLDLSPGFWEGTGHIGLGDTIAFRAKRGPRLDVEIAAMQVTEIAIDHDADGGEGVRLSVVVPT